MQHTRPLLVASLLLISGAAFGQTRPAATPAVPTTPVAASAAAAPATEPGAKAKKPPSAKQLAAYERMRRCNAEAREKTLSGDPRKAFMKGCLSTHGAPAT